MAEPTFDTALGDKEPAFQEWMKAESLRRGRDVSRDLEDYDLRGYYRTIANQKDAANGHMTDQFKKPNHPTFSTGSQYSGAPGAYVGGVWADDGSSYTPSAEMFAHGHNVQEMQRYFAENEPGVRLVLPKAQPTPSKDRSMANQVLTPEMVAALAQLSGVPGQQDLADNELTKAAALRRQTPVRAAGKWGGIAAGLANAVNGIDAAISSRMGADQKRAAYQQQEAGLAGLRGGLGKIDADQAALEAYNKQLAEQQFEGPSPTMIAPTGVK